MASLARVITLFGPKGGVGRSFTAVNLAVALANRGKSSVALVDLDWLAGGSLASALDIEPIRATWADWVAGKQSLEQVLHPHASGLRLVPAPPAGEAAISPEQVVEMLSQLGQTYEWVVVDTCWPHLSPLMLPMVDLASTVLLMLTPEIGVIQAGKAVLERARDLRFPSDRFQVVLNREGVTADISADDVASTLKKSLVGRIPNHPVVVSSFNRGLPLAGHAPNHPVGKAIHELAAWAKGLPPVDLAVRRMTELPPEFANMPKPMPTAMTGRLPQLDGENQMVIPAQPEVLAMVPAALERDQMNAYKQQVHARLVEVLKLEDLPFDRLSDPALKATMRDEVAARANRIIDELKIELRSRSERTRLVMDIANEAIGYGPLEHFLADEGVTEIMVNGPEKIFVEQGGRLTLSHRTFTDEQQLRVVIDRIVAPIGRRVDESSPMCDARLPDGSRVNVIVPPLALNGSTITIRKFSKKRLAMPDLVKFDSLTEGMASFLEACVKGKLNIFISGGTGSGKTTLLNVMSGFIPEGERIVTIEDAAELRLNQSHVVSLEARPPNLEGQGAVPIRDLVKNSLRMRPDRVIVGEVRGGEALDMLQAMNTGHDGSLATGHANTPRDALSRLETMVLMAGMDLPVRAIREQIASALHIIVQQTRLADGSRKIVKISEVLGMEGDMITLQDIFEFQQTGRSATRVEGEFRTTGLRPYCLEQLESMGLPLPPELFGKRGY